MDWLLQNVQWVFSGVGVVIVVGILQWLYRANRIPSVRRQEELPAPVGEDDSEASPGRIDSEPKEEQVVPVTVSILERTLDLGDFLGFRYLGMECRLVFLGLEKVTSMAGCDEPAVRMKVGGLIDSLVCGQRVASAEGVHKGFVVPEGRSTDASLAHIYVEAKSVQGLQINVDHINESKEKAHIRVALFSGWS